MTKVLGANFPDNWSATRIKWATSLLTRGSAPNYADDGAVRVISQASNQDGGIDWSRTRFHEFNGDATKLKGHLLPGDILINSTGTGTLGRVGFFSGAPDGSPCMADSHVTTMRTNKGILYPRYAYYWMRSQPVQDYVYAALVVGATNQIELNRDRLANTLIPLPPLEEQRRIADFLDAETARIDGLTRLQNILLNKLDERDQALRDSLVDKLAREQGELPLRRFTTLIEQGISPQCDAFPREDSSEWAVLKLSAIKHGSFNPEENKRLPDGVTPARAYEVRPGDLLITRANTPTLVGDVAVATENCKKLLLPDLIYRVGLAANVLPEYIAQIAMSSRIRLLIESTARGSSQSMVKLRGEDIKEWPIPAATPAQQKKLVQEITGGTLATGNLRSAVNRQLELLAERKQALITAAVTGQFDVSSASGRGVVE